MIQNKNSKRDDLDRISTIMMPDSVIITSPEQLGYRNINIL
jgi:hypothetical protein